MKKILGIDVGGTKIAAGLVDNKFRVTKVAIIPTSQTDLVGQLSRLIEDYEDYDGIGLGMPGAVLSNGMVNHLENVPNFKPTNLKKLLERKFRVPVSVINDAKAFALAEATIGAGKDFQIVAGVILGTGIGVGFILNKQIYLGYNSLAGEIGHFQMPNGKMFEQEVKQAGPYKNAAGARKYLRSLMSFIIRSIDPEIIVVGGGWGKLSGMQSELNEIIKTLRKFPVKTKVVISKLKHAGIIGVSLQLLKPV